MIERAPTIFREVDPTRRLVLVLLALVPIGCTAVAPAREAGPVAGGPRVAVAVEPRSVPPQDVPVVAPAQPAPGSSGAPEPHAIGGSASDIDALREAARLAPGDPDARHRLALALLARERERGEADGELRPEASDPRAQTYLDLGRALVGRGDMVEAVAWFREALSVEPDLVAARSGLGIALYGMGDLDAAVEELGALRRTRPDLVEPRLALATVLVAKQDWVAARAELEAVLTMRPDMVQARYTLGVVRYTLGDLDGAIEEYKGLLAIDPGQPDARFKLALMLKLAHRDAEATPELLLAAAAGLPRAQYFAGAAYAEGQGVPRDLVRAITWWFRAQEQGVPQAGEALARLRQVALGRSRRPPAERLAAERAFATYRAELGAEFPGVTRDGDEPLGAALLREGRVTEGVTVLIREASALSDPAERLLETLYVEGVDGRLPAYDGYILEYFKGAAAEGQLRPRLVLARCYARGLGVPKDVARAVSLLKATPHEDAQRLLEELSAGTP
jgi:TPR repeat protein